MCNLADRTIVPLESRPPQRAPWRRLGWLLMLIALCGCTSVRDYVKNGLKVGPNYGRPPAAVANTWIDANDVRVRTKSDDLSNWWSVFNDPALNWLICTSYHQNLSLREAGFRVMQARAQWAIGVGNVFPQTQYANGSATRNASSRQTVAGLHSTQQFYSQWDLGFNLGWELDFWGRFRRAVEADAALLDASVENYDDVLVTLLSDVAENYVEMRTLELRLRYTLNNVQIQRDTLKIVEARFNAGTTSELDVHQAANTLAQTEAQVPELEILVRQTVNQLCILLGMPPEELRTRLGPAPIPVAPTEVAVGIPADLLRRRPDVRRAERQAAAQSALIGVAESDFYPHIAINGIVGFSSQEMRDLIQPASLRGTVGPSFQWNILNYGRLLNNVRVQDARFQELVAVYQNTVLTANRDAENGLVMFLKAQERTRLQQRCVSEAEKAVNLALLQYKAGTTDFTRVTQIEQNMVEQQDVLTQAQGEIAQGLIRVYRSLGGGWQIRINGCAVNPPVQAVQPQPLGPPVPSPARPTNAAANAVRPAMPPAQGGSVMLGPSLGPGR